ncbi:hypothetical protein PG994_008576 [Apiospora phragmitis]|uniref:Uncharacterized protein n=1 Tax=Apiospora phragmitis TaxID=2905665 RepID=A0ABR1UJR4_9PEZI
MQVPRVIPASSGGDAEPRPETNPGQQQAATPAAAHNRIRGLSDPENFQHIAVFADALFRSLPSDLGLAGFDGISAALEQTIKNHSFTVACDGKDDSLTEATCRRLGFLMYRHRRRIIAILRQRYSDAEVPQ